MSTKTTTTEAQLHNCSRKKGRVTETQWVEPDVFSAPPEVINKRVTETQWVEPDVFSAQTLSHKVVRLPSELVQRCMSRARFRLQLAAILT